jgi:hypothetical protein
VVTETQLSSLSETAVYTAGAGLGASKGKEVGKYAEGFSSYSHMVQDAVSFQDSIMDT